MVEAVDLLDQTLGFSLLGFHAGQLLPDAGGKSRDATDERAQRTAVLEPDQRTARRAFADAAPTARMANQPIHHQGGAAHECRIGLPECGEFTAEAVDVDGLVAHRGPQAALRIVGNVAEPKQPLQPGEVPLQHAEDAAGSTHPATSPPAPPYATTDRTERSRTCHPDRRRCWRR